MRYLIGIDVGTSATKTVLFDEEGRVTASASQEYPLYQPHNGWAEQRPEDWRDAVLSTLKQVVADAGVPADEIKGIGISGQMHGLVMLDEMGEVIRPSIIWCDQRTGREVEDMLHILPRERWIEITANPPLTGWTAAKILWVRKHEPECYERCRHILLPKDYIRYILTGDFATEVSDASGMQLLDVPGRCWSQEVLEKLKIDPALLGRVYESCEVTGYDTAGNRGKDRPVRSHKGGRRSRGQRGRGGGHRRGEGRDRIYHHRDLRRGVCPQRPGDDRSQGTRPHLLLCGAGGISRDGSDTGGGAVPEVV